MKDIPSTELEDFKTSLHNTERETSVVHNDLCTWKTPVARHPVVGRGCIVSWNRWCHVGLVL